MSKPKIIITIMIVLMCGIVAPAHAYIDAGSGSYMLQMAMAGLFGILFFVKSFLGKVVYRFKHK